MEEKHEEVGEYKTLYQSAEVKRLEALSYIDELGRNHTEPRKEAGREREDLQTQYCAVKRHNKVRPILYGHLTIIYRDCFCINFLLYFCTQDNGGNLPE